MHVLHGMYDSSIILFYFRNWNNLPEVKAKEKKEKREREAATNRLRARLYQKVSLTHYI